MAKQTDPHLRVRIPPSLLSRLERAREKSGRTLSGEIIHRIEQAFQTQEIETVVERAVRTALVSDIGRMGRE